MKKFLSEKEYMTTTSNVFRYTSSFLKKKCFSNNFPRLPMIATLSFLKTECKIILFHQSKKVSEESRLFYPSTYEAVHKKKENIHFLRIFNFLKKHLSQNHKTNIIKLSSLLNLFLKRVQELSK